MSYIQGNKEAWEEAFEHRHPSWGDDVYRRLLDERLPFFCPDVVAELEKIDFKGKKIAQFCCNNGREILSLLQLGAESATGFDIAENILDQAADTAKKANINNCEFVACNILDIPQKYHSSFDFIIFTIGAITWFEDLNLLFKKVSDCLAPNGILFIHDFHPFINMLPLPGEPEFDGNDLNRIEHSYFRKEPWIENEGMSYMSETYASRTFTSFTHKTSDIINAASVSGLSVTMFNEYDYDVGLTSVYNKMGFPLSFIFTAEKR